MIVDCDSCAVRGPACGDCVVTFLLGPPDWLGSTGLPGGELPGEELAALAVLADSGLVPPLRLVPRAPAPEPGDPPPARTATG